MFPVVWYGANIPDEAYNTLPDNLMIGEDTTGRLRFIGTKEDIQFLMKNIWNRYIVKSEEEAVTWDNEVKYGNIKIKR